MQTFLPYEDFALSAMVLDDRRLGKQRVETMQIMQALMTGVGWVSHPATLMWRRYEWALLQYQEAICYEWTHQRGHKDTCLEKTRWLYNHHKTWVDAKIFPYWLGDLYFHVSHQSNLMRKEPDHYKRFFPSVSNKYEYVWPPPLDDYIRLRNKVLWTPKTRQKPSI